MLQQAQHERIFFQRLAIRDPFVPEPRRRTPKLFQQPATAFPAAVSRSVVCRLNSSRRFVVSVGSRIQEELGQQ
jgi:hypothetical protein